MTGTTSAERKSRLSEGLSAVFGAALIGLWVLETTLWVYSSIHALGGGDPGPVSRRFVRSC